jgi:hypothetical protein
MTSESKTPAIQTRLRATLAPFVEEVVARFALAGLAVGIVKDGALVYAQGFGVRSLATLQPDAAQAYELLGQACMITGARDEAAVNLRRALELDPDNVHARDLLQQLGSMPARREDAP